MFEYVNPFNVYFPDHEESAGEAPVSAEAETESKTHHLEPVVTPAEFVHELVPAEGHMINPITGETEISYLLLTLLYLIYLFLTPEKLQAFKVKVCARMVGCIYIGFHDFVVCNTILSRDLPCEVMECSWC